MIKRFTLVLISVFFGIAISLIFGNMTSFSQTCSVYQGSFWSWLTSPSQALADEDTPGFFNFDGIVFVIGHSGAQDSTGAPAGDTGKVEWEVFEPVAQAILDEKSNDNIKVASGGRSNVGEDITDRMTRSNGKSYTAAPHYNDQGYKFVELHFDRNDDQGQSGVITQQGTNTTAMDAFDRSLVDANPPGVGEPYGLYSEAYYEGGGLFLTNPSKMSNAHGGTILEVGAGNSDIVERLANEDESTINDLATQLISIANTALEKDSLSDQIEQVEEEIEDLEKDLENEDDEDAREGIDQELEEKRTQLDELEELDRQAGSSPSNPGGGSGGSGGSGGGSSQVGPVDYVSFTAFPGIGNINSMCQLIAALWQLGFIVLFISVFGSFLYGGFLYTSAGVNAAQVNTAKGIFKNAAISLLLGLSVFIILNTLNPDLVTGTCGVPSIDTATRLGRGENTTPTEGTVLSGPVTGNRSCEGCVSLRDAGATVANWNGIDGPNRTDLVLPEVAEATLWVEDETSFQTQVTAAWTNGVGHSNGSQHYQGTAVDLQSTNGPATTSAQLEEIADNCREAGFSFVLIEASHVHCDTVQR